MNRSVHRLHGAGVQRRVRVRRRIVLAGYPRAAPPLRAVREGQHLLQVADLPVSGRCRHRGRRRRVAPLCAEPSLAVSVDAEEPGDVPRERAGGPALFRCQRALPRTFRVVFLLAVSGGIACSAVPLALPQDPYLQAAAVRATIRLLKPVLTRAVCPPWPRSIRGRRWRASFAGGFASKSHSHPGPINRGYPLERHRDYGEDSSGMMREGWRLPPISPTSSMVGCPGWAAAPTHGP